MALKFPDSTWETSTSTGTGDITLAGARAGQRPFSESLANGDTVYCRIQAVSASNIPTGEFEIVLCTYVSETNKLTRDATPLQSSNSDSPVDFAAGTKDVFAVAPSTVLESLVAHLSNTSNPHSVTAAQVGLGASDSVTFNGVAITNFSDGTPGFTLAVDTSGGTLSVYDVGAVSVIVDGLSHSIELLNSDPATTIVLDGLTGVGAFTAITVTDSTAVANLNADLLDGQHAAAFALAGHNHDAIYQPLDADLTALAGVSATGLLARTGAGTAEARTITGTANQIIVNNGNGAGGNPTLSTPQNIHTAATPQFAGLGIGKAGTSGRIDLTGTSAEPVQLERTGGSQLGIKLTHTGGSGWFGLDSSLAWRVATTANIGAGDLVTHPDKSLLVGAVSTTNATITSIYAFNPTANTTYCYKATFVARCTGGTSGTVDDGAHFERRFGSTTKAGTVTAIGSVQTMGTDQKDASLSTATVTLSVSGTQILAAVTGVANVNISWQVFLEVIKID